MKPYIPVQNIFFDSPPVYLPIQEDPNHPEIINTIDTAVQMSQMDMNNPLLSNSLSNTKLDQSQEYEPPNYKRVHRLRNENIPEEDLHVKVKERQKFLSSLKEQIDEKRKSKEREIIVEKEKDEWMENRVKKELVEQKLKRKISNRHELKRVGSINHYN